MSRSPFMLALGVALPLLGSGCSPVEGQEDAGHGLRAMLVALGPGPANLFPDPIRIEGPVQFRSTAEAPPVGFEVERTDIECPDDGHFLLDGSTNHGDARIAQFYGGEARAFDFEVRFRHCRERGTTIGGAIDYAMVPTLGEAPEDLTIAWSYTGEVRFRGDIEGTCEVDLQVTGESYDAFRDLEARLYAGTFCGFDAEEVAALANLDDGLAPRPVP